MKTKLIFAVVFVFAASVMYYLFFSNEEEFDMKTSNWEDQQAPEEKIEETDISDSVEKTENNNEKRRDSYGDDIQKAVISFLEKEQENFGNSFRGGCLPPEPFNFSSHSNYLFDVATGKIDYHYENAEKLCVHLNNFISKAIFSDDKKETVGNIVKRFEKLIGSVSVHVTNKTDVTAIFDKEKIKPNNSKTVELNLTRPCRLGGYSPYVFEMVENGIPVTAEIKFCDDLTKKIIGGKYEISVEGCNKMKKQDILAKTPLQIKIVITKG